jgi:aryl carrier-like protein
VSDDLLKRIEQLSPERRELLEMLMKEKSTEVQTSYVEPRTPVEEALTTIWSQVLGIKQVGIYDNFLELGGDSIQSIQIVAKAHEAGLQFSSNQLFELLTIAELAMVVETIPAPQAEQGSVTVEELRSPITDYQLTDTPSFTPSDFPEAELSQEEFNKLFMNNT